LITNNTPAAICSGDAFNVVFAGADIVPSGTTYNWTVTTSGNISGHSDVNGASVITQTLTNESNVQQTVAYTVTPTAGSCVGVSFTVIVTVNPRPVIANNTPAAICSGDAFNVVFSGTDIVPAGTTYSWTVTTSGRISGHSDVNDASIITQTLTNESNVQQTATYTVTPTAGSCVGSPFTVTVTVSPKPEINNIPVSAICSGEDFTVTPVNGVDGIVPAGTTYTWFAPSVTNIIGAISGTDATNINSGTLTNNTNDTPIDVVYTITPTAGSCTGASFEVTVTVNPIPPAPTTRSHVGCPTQDSEILDWSDLITGSTGTIKWYDVATGGVEILYPGTYDSAVPATVSYWVTQTIDGCESPHSEEIRVEISTEPVDPVISDYFQCAEVVGTLKPWSDLVLSQIAGSTLIWYTADNDASIMGSLDNPESPPAFNTGEVRSSTTYYVVVKDAQDCVTNRAPVTAEVWARPTATLSGDNTICNGQSSDLTVEFTGKAPFIFTYTPGTTITTGDNPLTITVSPTATTTYTLTALRDDNGCNADVTELPGEPQITVHDVPVITESFPIDPLCSGDELLQPTEPFVNDNGSPVTTEWQIGQGTTFETLNFPYEVSDADNGKTVRFIATNSCGGDNRDVTLTVNPLPTVTLENPEPFCEGTLTGEPAKTIALYTINWTDGEPNAGSQTANNSPHEFTYTVTTNATTCTSDLHTYKVTVNPIPAAPEVTEVNFLTDNVSSSLPTGLSIADGAQADAGTSNTLRWYTSQSGTGSTSVPHHTNPIPGTYNYWVKQFTNPEGCESEFSTIVVNVLDANPPEVSNTTQCQDETPADPTILAQADENHQLLWYDSKDAAKSSGVTTPPTIKTDVVGVFEFFVAQQSTASLAISEKSEFTVTVNATPTVKLTPPAAFCEGALDSEPVKGIAGYNITWYTAEDGATVAGVPVIQSLTAGDSPHNFYYNVENQLTNCVSDIHTYMVTVNAMPTVVEPDPQTVCSGETVSAVLFTGTPADAKYEWINSNASIGLDAGGTGDIDDFEASNTTDAVISGTITVTPKTDYCTGEAVTFDITVKPTPTVIQPENQIRCAGLWTDIVNFEGNIPTGVTYDWTNSNTSIGHDAAGTNHIPSFKAENTTASTLSGAITVIPTLDGCEGEQVTFTITVDPTPVIAVTNNDRCGEGAVTLSATATAGATVNWYENIGDETPVHSGASYSPTISQTTAYWVESVLETDYGSCKSANREKAEAVIKNFPSINGLTPPVICQGASIPLTVVPTPSTANVTWYDNGGAFVGSGNSVTVTPPYIKSGNSYRSTYTYTVKVNDECESSFPVHVYIDENLPSSNGIFTDKTQACENAKITLSVNTAHNADSYVWSSSISDEEKEELSIIEYFTGPVTYYLLLTRGECTRTYEEYIEINTKPVIERVERLGARDIEIIVMDGSGTPPFEYRVDHFPFDDNPVKSGLLFGMRRFYVIDDFGCISDAFEHRMESPISIPSFFSPNGDGVNDTWDIEGIEVYPDAIITIYDRFGKELTRYKGSAQSGWDGKYRGKDMSSTDYWYIIKIDEIDEQHVGHFTLIRK
jgi:gliding motility-associated-like protein